MNRTLRYEMQPDMAPMKISSFLKEQGYSAKNLTSLRRTPDSFWLQEALAEQIQKDVHMNAMVKAGDQLTVFVRETTKEEKIVPVELPFPVVYEDEDLVVVNKPAGMPIHPSLRHYENTLANAAAYYYREDIDTFVYRCINRLDKNTTGLTILAKNPLSGHLLQEQMRQGRIKRTYTAMVEGILPQKKGCIDLPIARKEASIIERVVHPDGERAVTHYEVLEELGEVSVVRCQLETGRTHQIRVHMKALGHPLIGDDLYAPGRAFSGMERQALHGGELLFWQPITGKKIHIATELPEDMQIFLQKKRFPLSSS